MGGIDCSHTGIRVVVCIHTEAKWFVVPEGWCAPVTVVVTNGKIKLKFLAKPKK